MVRIRGCRNEKTIPPSRNCLAEKADSKELRMWLKVSENAKGYAIHFTKAAKKASQK